MGKLRVRDGKTKDQHHVRSLLLNFKARGQCDVSIVTESGVQATIRHAFRYGTGKTITVTARDLVMALRPKKLKRE